MKDDAFFDLSHTEAAPVSATPAADPQSPSEETDTPAEIPASATDGLAFAAPPARWLQGTLLGFPRWQVGLFVLIFAGVLGYVLSDDTPVTGTPTGGQFARVDPLPVPTPSAPGPGLQQVLSGQQALIDVNRQALAVLAQRLDQDDSRLATLTQQNTLLQAQIQTLLQRPQLPAAATKHGPVKRSALSGMHINTLYPGMAWLEYHGATWAVREGDTLQGLRIGHIDPQSGTVETSAGTLHQE
jgi:hypothetical protein